MPISLIVPVVIKMAKKNKDKYCYSLDEFEEKYLSKYTRISILNVENPDYKHIARVLAKESLKNLY